MKSLTNRINDAGKYVHDKISEGFGYVSPQGLALTTALAIGAIGGAGNVYGGKIDASKIPVGTTYTITQKNCIDRKMEPSCNYATKTFTMEEDGPGFRTVGLNGRQMTHSVPVQDDPKGNKDRVLANLYSIATKPTPPAPKRPSRPAGAEAPVPSTPPIQQSTAQEPGKKSPAQIAEEHCEKNPKLCPNKPTVPPADYNATVTGEIGASITRTQNPETQKQSREPSNGYWVFSAGGDSNDRAFGQVGYRWKVGNDNRNRLGLELRAYSKSPVEQVGTSEKITSVDEALVGPGIYRTRTDEETIETDRKLGRLGLIAHFGYLPEYFRNQLELFGNVGATSYDKTRRTRLKTTVKLEDSEGKPIGNSETATQRLEPEKETRIIPIVELGITWHIPNTNILLGVSEEVSPDLGAKTNAKFGLKF